MTIRVAIASECGESDGEIYRGLLEIVLDRPVERWRAKSVRFVGWKKIYRLLPAFLELAEKDNVDRTLIAVDNDGGARRHPEHVDAHEPIAPGTPLEDLIAEEEHCRVCAIHYRLPPGWSPASGRSSIVVPVQVLETWILCITGPQKLRSRTPEQFYGRDHLKKKCWGKPIPTAAARVRIALEAFRQPGALEVLRKRLSFRRFEAETLRWIACSPSPLSTPPARTVTPAP